MAYKFVFRIRTRYYDQIVANTKKVEYRRDVKFWHIRIVNLFYELNFGFYPVENPKVLFKSPSISGALAVFICGKRKHVRQLIGIERIVTPEYFSDQGKKDVNTETCLAFHLGKEFC